MRTYRHKRILDRRNMSSAKFDVPLYPYTGQSRTRQYQREQESNVRCLVSLIIRKEHSDLRVGFASAPTPPDSS